jgi:hypothetical protein
LLHVEVDVVTDVALLTVAVPQTNSGVAVRTTPVPVGAVNTIVGAVVHPPPAPKYVG